jgi:competence protein ComEA
VSLTLASVVGALAVVVWGWPRGETAGSAGADPDPAAASNVLVEPEGGGAPSAARVVVDVDGEVRRPGVVELASGARVVDAIRAAGGLTSRGDTGTLNLAEVLIDGQQVTVPSTRAPAAPAPAGSADSTGPGASAAGPVSLNSATAEQLETLPGIGPVLAAAIIDWRAENGGFTSIDQLQEVSGIGPATFADVAPLISL